MTSNPLVSILIINYNGQAFLHDCFKSVLASTYPSFEVILVDNASTDNSIPFTQENFPEVQVYETGRNGGYSFAYNLSFNHAKGKYFVLLNNDVTVEPDWLEPLVEGAEQDANIGALQPKLVSMVDPSNFEYAGASGGFMDIYGFPFLRGRVFNHMEKDEGQYDHEVRVFWTSGAAMFLRADAIPKIGKLDEDFFMHMEEIDYCWRLNLAGYALKVIPESRVYHYGGASLPAESYMKNYLNHRNSVIMLIKNLSSDNLKSILVKRWLLDLFAIAASLAKFEMKRVKAIIAAHLWLLSKPSYLWKKHEAVQQIRQISDDQIFKLLYPKSIALQFFLKGRKTYKALMEAIE